MTRRKISLFFIGAMTDSERETLLHLANGSMLSDVAQAQFIAAIDVLFEAPNNSTLEVDNIFITEDDSTHILFDSDPAFNIEQRFNYILLKLMPHLRESLSKTLVTQKLAEVLDVKVRIMDELLTNWVNSPSHPTQKAITEFLKKAFSESNTRVVLDEAIFVDQFSTFRLLHKIGIIISKFKLTSNQLIWLFKNEYGPSVGWLNLNLLPVIDGALPQSFGSWEKLYDLIELRNGLRNGESVLTKLFGLAREPGITRDTLLEKLSEETEWKLDDLKALTDIKAFDTWISNDPNIAIPEAYKDERAMKQLKACFSVMKLLGISAQQCIKIANPDPTANELLDMSRDIKQAIKAKYDNEQWLAIARPLRDALREKQRSCLVAYLITHPDPDPIKKQNWTNINGLYSHFLIDVEMSPCQVTSRIKQANRSGSNYSFNDV